MASRRKCFPTKTWIRGCRCYVADRPLISLNAHWTSDRFFGTHYPTGIDRLLNRERYGRDGRVSGAAKTTARAHPRTPHAHARTRFALRGTIITCPPRRVSPHCASVGVSPGRACPESCPVSTVRPCETKNESTGSTAAPRPAALTLRYSPERAGPLVCFTALRSTRRPLPRCSPPPARCPARLWRPVPRAKALSDETTAPTQRRAFPRSPRAPSSGRSRPWRSPGARRRARRTSTRTWRPCARTRCARRVWWSMARISPRSRMYPPRTSASATASCARPWCAAASSAR